MVDDDTVFREELTRLLDEDGHQVVNSPSVVKAIAELEARDVDVLLTDLKMPRQGGLELLKEVRHRWPRTLVIVLTGFATVETAVESMKQGAFDYVRKPFEIKEIQRVLDAAARELRYAEEGSPGVDPASLIRKWVSADHREVLLITDRPVPSRDGVTVLRPDFSNPYRIREDVDGFVDARTRVAVVVESVDRLFATHRREDIVAIVKAVRAKVDDKGPLLLTFDPVRLSAGDVLELRAAASAQSTHGTLESLANPLRRAVLRRAAQGPCTFGEAMAAAGLDDESPKLSFHLRKLQDDGLLSHESDSYRITPRGKEAIDLLERLDSITGDALRSGGVLPRAGNRRALERPDRGARSRREQARRARGELTAPLGSR